MVDWTMPRAPHFTIFCITCNKAIERFDSNYLMSMGSFRASCHGRIIPATISCRDLDDADRDKSIWILGFDGPWTVTLQDPMMHPHTALFKGPPLGRYQQEDLVRFFTPGPHGLPQIPMHFGFDPRIYNINNIEENFSFPAQFWFPHHLSAARA